MDLIATFESHLRNAATALVADGVLGAVPERVIVEPAPGEGRGDLTSILALAAGGSARIEPRLLAEKIAERLRDNPDFAAVEIAGPGFLNLTVASSAWGRMLASLLAAGGDYGRIRQDEARGVDIGFLPADASHLLPADHARCSVVGDALANLFDFTGLSTSRNYRVNGEGTITVRLGQPVRLLRKGIVVATNASLRDLIAEIGDDAARYGMLAQRNSAPVELDLDLLQDLSNDNPLFHVQYAHARCCAIRERGERTFPGLTTTATKDIAVWDMAAFEDESARLILRRLALYPGQIAQAARAYEPHRLAAYLRELASELHAQYYRSLSAPYLRFIRDDDRLLTGARLAFVRGVETVLKSGLALLGVCAPDEVR
jgi:arginyl-tRNA synthetase